MFKNAICTRISKSAGKLRLIQAYCGRECSQEMPSFAYLDKTS